MITTVVPDRPGSRRRTPQQKRSRERVERILDAAGELVTERGMPGITTRTCAHRADVPIASLYQYFADKDQIMVALMERSTAQLDARIADAVDSLDRLSIRTVVEATMGAYVDVCRQRPDIATLWWRGRTNAAVMEFCLAHHRWMAGELFGLFSQAGLVRPGTDPVVGELAVQVGDRAFEIAFRDDLRGDPAIVTEGIELMVGYLERYATSAGLDGVMRSETVGKHAS